MPVPSPAPAPTPTENYDIVNIGADLMGSIVTAIFKEEVCSRLRILVLKVESSSHKQLGRVAAEDHGHPDWNLHDLTPSDLPVAYCVGLPCWGISFVEACCATPAFLCKVLGCCGVMNGILTQSFGPDAFGSWAQGFRWDNLLPYQISFKLSFSIVAAPSKDGENCRDNMGSPQLRTPWVEQRFQLSDAFESHADRMSATEVTSDAISAGALHERLGWHVLGGQSWLWRILP